MLKWYKASSLLHAVFVCLLIALVCFGMLLLASYNSLFQQQTLAKTQLQLTNDAAIEWQLSNENVAQTETIETSMFDDDIQTNIKTIHWGFYKVIAANSTNKKDTIRKAVLVGNIKSDKTALYVTDYDKIQQMAGTIKIVGDVKVPKARLEEKNIQGEKTTIQLDGMTTASQDKLPKINSKTHQLPNTYDREFTVGNLEENTLYTHSFAKETALLNIQNEHALIGKKLKGNIIIEKTGTFTITKQMALEDVIVKADEVKIEAGFIGNIQIIAKKTVFIENDVRLNYPSSIIIEKPSKFGNISIGKNSVLMGGIILKNAIKKNALESFITIEKDALIVGDIYCNGNLELYGKVYGSVYTDYLMTRIEKASHKNMLMNIEIDRSKLPKTFASILTFETTSTKRMNYEVIKEF